MTTNVTDDTHQYPLASTNIEIDDGDEVEIRVLGANTTTLDCGVGRTSPIGKSEPEHREAALFPNANHCALIGRIGDGPYFAVGAYYKSVSDVGGKLHLGINDVPPEFCGLDPPEKCYEDNFGELAVKVTVIRR